jgi:hypothetical protein
MVPAMIGVMAKGFRRASVPLCCYYAITLALPVANGAAKAGITFVEHALVVLVVPPILIVLVCTAHAIGRRCMHGVRRLIQRCA